MLAEEGVLSGELGISASDVEGRAKKGRIARRPGEMEGSQFQSCQCGVDVPDKPVDEGRHAEEAPDGRSKPISG